MAEEREGLEYLREIPSSAGSIVAMTLFKGKLYFACEFAIFVLVDDGFEKVLSVNRSPDIEEPKTEGEV